MHDCILIDIPMHERQFCYFLRFKHVRPLPEKWGIILITGDGWVGLRNTDLVEPTFCAPGQMAGFIRFVGDFGAGYIINKEVKTFGSEIWNRGFWTSIFRLPQER